MAEAKESSSNELLLSSLIREFTLYIDEECFQDEKKFRGFCDIAIPFIKKFNKQMLIRREFMLNFRRAIEFEAKINSAIKVLKGLGKRYIESHDPNLPDMITNLLSQGNVLFITQDHELATIIFTIGEETKFVPYIKFINQEANLQNFPDLKSKHAIYLGNTAQDAARVKYIVFDLECLTDNSAQYFIEDLCCQTISGFTVLILADDLYRVRREAMLAHQTDNIYSKLVGEYNVIGTRTDLANLDDEGTVRKLRYQNNVAVLTYSPARASLFYNMNNKDLSGNKIIPFQLVRDEATDKITSKIVCDYDNPWRSDILSLKDTVIKMLKEADEAYQKYEQEAKAKELEEAKAKEEKAKAQKAKEEEAKSLAEQKKVEENKVKDTVLALDSTKEQDASALGDPASKSSLDANKDDKSEKLAKGEDKEQSSTQVQSQETPNKPSVLDKAENESAKAKQSINTKSNEENKIGGAGVSSNVNVSKTSIDVHAEQVDKSISIELTNEEKAVEVEISAKKTVIDPGLANLSTEVVADNEVMDLDKSQQLVAADLNNDSFTVDNTVVNEELSDPLVKVVTTPEPKANVVTKASEAEVKEKVEDVTEKATADENIAPQKDPSSLAAEHTTVSLTATMAEIEEAKNAKNNDKEGGKLSAAILKPLSSLKSKFSNKVAKLSKDKHDAKSTQTSTASDAPIVPQSANPTALTETPENITKAKQETPQKETLKKDTKEEVKVTSKKEETSAPSLEKHTKETGKEQENTKAQEYQVKKSEVKEEKEEVPSKVEPKKAVEHKKVTLTSSIPAFNVKPKAKEKVEVKESEVKNAEVKDGTFKKEEPQKSIYEKVGLKEPQNVSQNASAKAPQTFAEPAKPEQKLQATKPQDSYLGKDIKSQDIKPKKDPDKKEEAQKNQPEKLETTSSVKAQNKTPEKPQVNSPEKTETTKKAEHKKVGLTGVTSGFNVPKKEEVKEVITEVGGIDLKVSEQEGKLSVTETVNEMPATVTEAVVDSEDTSKVTLVDVVPSKDEFLDNVAGDAKDELQDQEEDKEDKQGNVGNQVKSASNDDQKTILKPPRTPKSYTLSSSNVSQGFSLSKEQQAKLHEKHKAEKLAKEKALEEAKKASIPEKRKEQHIPQKVKLSGSTSSFTLNEEIRKKLEERHRINNLTRHEVDQAEAERKAEELAKINQDIAIIKAIEEYELKGSEGDFVFDPNSDVKESATTGFEEFEMTPERKAALRRYEATNRSEVGIKRDLSRTNLYRTDDDTHKRAYLGRNTQRKTREVAGFDATLLSDSNNKFEHRVVTNPERSSEELKKINDYIENRIKTHNQEQDVKTQSVTTTRVTSSETIEVVEAASSAVAVDEVNADVKKQVVPFEVSGKAKVAMDDGFEVLLPTFSDKVYVDHELCTLDKPLVMSSDISVFDFKDNLAIKIFNQDYFTKTLSEKITTMLSQKITLDGVCWPIKPVMNLHESLVGVIIKHSKAKSLKQLFRGQGVIIKDGEFADLVAIARDLLEKLNSLEKLNVFLGDEHLESILVTLDKKVVLENLEQMQVGDYLYSRGFGANIAPELAKNDNLCADASSANFVVAVLLFKILFKGLEPFLNISNGVGSDFRFKDHADNQTWNALPDDIKDAFKQVFTEGIDDKAQRLTISKWIELLAEV